MNIKDKISSNPLAIANAFNTYFSFAAENLLIKNLSGNNINNNRDAISYLHQNFIQSFLNDETQKYYYV
jgi:D-hexose-6-phosphate mutarotase